jgi:hypothetical protein
MMNALDIKQIIIKGAHSMNSIRLSRTEDRTFVKPAGTLNVVNERAMLYKPGLYGWNMENPAVHFDPCEFESELAFDPKELVEQKR